MIVKPRHGKASLVFVCAAAIFGVCGAAHADEMHTVFVPRNVIYPGDVITADALVERQVSSSLENHAFFGENPKDLIGKVARRTLIAGQFVPRSAVRAEDVIRQGRPYKMTYNSEFISIVGTGVPLQSGAVGEIISVRNPTSGMIVKARVLPDRTLTVDVQ
jgi:flagella basal body P-ring formation protein FlgA